jgi:hypothetical protein
MVFTPYVCLAAVVFFIVRGVRKNERFRLAHGATGEPAHQPEA